MGPEASPCLMARASWLLSRFCSAGDSVGSLSLLAASSLIHGSLLHTCWCLAEIYFVEDFSHKYIPDSKLPVNFATQFKKPHNNLALRLRLRRRGPELVPLASLDLFRPFFACDWSWWEGSAALGAAPAPVSASGAQPLERVGPWGPWGGGLRLAAPMWRLMAVSLPPVDRVAELRANRAHMAGGAAEGATGHAGLRVP